MNLHADVHPITILNNQAWLISGEDNFLYKIDIEKWEASFVTELNFDAIYLWRGNYIGLVYQNKLICLPDRSDKIEIYDIDSKKLDYIQMPQNITKRWGISAYILKQDNLYLFSATERLILKVCMKNGRVEIYDYIEEEKDILYVLAKGNEFLFIIQEKGTCFCRYDVVNKQLNKTLITEELYEVMCCDDDNIWFSGKRKKILLWNRKSSKRKEIDISSLDICEYSFISLTKENYMITKEEEFQDTLFYKQIVYGEYLWFFPLRSNYLIRINRENYKVEKIEFENETEDINSLFKRTNGLNSYKYFFEFVDSQNNLVVYSFKNKVHYIIDADRGIVKEVKGVISITNEENAINVLLDTGKIQAERMDFSLKELLKINKKRV